MWQKYEEKIGKVVLLSLAVMIIGMIIWGYYDQLTVGPDQDSEHYWVK